MKTDEKQEKRIMLVYQSGIANVFEVRCFNLANFGRDAKRLLQADFRTCESFARGMAAAGCIVRTVACKQGGDIINEKWNDHLGSQPFSDQFRPVTEN